MDLSDHSMNLIIRTWLILEWEEMSQKYSHKMLSSC